MKTEPEDRRGTISVDNKDHVIHSATITSPRGQQIDSYTIKKKKKKKKCIYSNLFCAYMLTLPKSKNRNAGAYFST